jgi:hypothetical protein
MTLVEFLEPLRSASHQARVLAVLYFNAHNKSVETMTTDQIRKDLRTARAKNAATINIADLLAKSAHLVDIADSDGKRRLWRLTDSGKEYVRDRLGLLSTAPEIEHDTGSLDELVHHLPDPDIRGYVEESLKCLQAGGLRACTVFLWAGTIRSIQERVLTKGAASASAALQKHDPRCRGVSKIDDFAYVKDSVTLLAAKDLGIFDKNQKDTLEEALDLRNRCGHPGKYRPGPKKVSAFIEDVINIVFKT